MRVLLSLVLAAGALGAPPALSSDTRFDVDPYEGIIDGRRAITFYPVRLGAPKPVLTDPTGYTAHLVPYANPDREDVLPAGEWLILEAGKYSVWMEGPDLISPRPRVFTYTPEVDDPDAHGIVSGDELVPAGTVALAAAVELGEHESLRLMSTGAHLSYDWVEREFVRRVARDAAHRGALMPASEVIAAVFDAEANAFTALTRPIAVRAAALTEVAPRPPADGFTDLMVRFERRGMDTDTSHHDLAPVLVTDDGPRPPDAMLHAASRCFAWWYDVRAARGRVEATSEHVVAPSTEVVLPSGRVQFVNIDLAARPSLGVDLYLPSELDTGEARLTIADLADRAVLRELELAETLAAGYDFESLPLAVLRVTLSAPPWAFSKTVDLTAGVDRRIAFDPTSALVHGRVTVGGEGATARVGFVLSAGDGERFAETETGPDGDYEILLFPEALGPVASVTVLDPPREPEMEWLAMSARDIRDGAVIDFALADNAVSVVVLDADTGLPIRGAEVRARQARTASNWSRRFLADESGAVVLPPIPADTELTVEALADGYRRAEPVTLYITGDTTEEGATLLLEPESDTAEVLLVLPDGTPAAGARLAIFGALDSRWSWEGAADESGMVEVPVRFAGGWLAGTHDLGGWLLEPWDGEAGGSRTVAFPPPGDPLSARVVTPAGDPVPFARVRVWVGERRLGDAVLAWLTGGSAVVSDEGLWVCRNAPRESLQVLAWSPRDGDLDPRAIAGEYDYLRTTVRFPWLGWNQLEVIMR